MKALILAAGLGTRLMPLTANLPKALVKINGVTLLEIAIRKIAAAGFSDIIVNVHHHAGQVIDFLSKNQFPGINISLSDESSLLLDTGGAIRKARWFLEGNDPFLVHNVDIISNISIQSLLSGHLKKNALATLSVSDRPTKRYFLFDKSLKLSGWTDTSTDETRWAGKVISDAQKLAFNGIHILSPEIFGMMEEKERFSVIDLYLKMAENKPIFGQLQPGNTWFDLGKPEQIGIVADFLKTHPEFTGKP